MSSIIWIIIAFISGAAPYSVWVGRLALRTDIRRYGDHNPGATNVARAGGWQWGLLAVILDMSKGAVPVGLAWYWGGLSGWPLVAVALAPILGHAYSPFLGFRGGKAIAVTGGVWAGLTVVEATLVMATLLVLWYLVTKTEGWAVTLGMLSFLGYLLVSPYSGHPMLLSVWAGNLLILAWKHRADLSQRPSLRPWLQKSF